MPFLTIPTAVASGLTAAEAAAAAAAAAQAATAATAFTAAAPTAATTLATTAPTLATTTALPGIVGGTGALGGAGSAGSVLSGAGGLSGGASTLAGVPGVAGANTLAATSPEIAANLAAAGNTGIMSGATSATGATGASGLSMEQMGQQFLQQAQAQGMPIAKEGIAQTLTAGDTVAPITTTPINTVSAPPISPSAPFAQNPAGTAQLGGIQSPISVEPATLPGDPTSAAPFNWNTTTPASNFTPPQSLAKAQEAAQATGTSYYDAVAPTLDPTKGTGITPTGNAFERGIKSAVEFAQKNPYTVAAGVAAANYLTRPEPPEKKKYGSPDLSGFQRSEPSTGVYTPVYKPMAYAMGGPVEQMADMNALGSNTGYPMANLQTPAYTNSAMQRPEAVNVVAPSADASVGAYTGEARFAKGGDVPAVDKVDARNRKLLGVKTPQEVEEDFQRGQEAMDKYGFGIVTDADVDTRRKSPLAASMTQLQKIGKRVNVPVTGMPKSGVIDTDVFHAAQGGITYGLGGYSDGGRLLKGPGDGVSDSIPASIGGRQPARLADGEFVIPARIVSELGNGSTEAGARKLYAMMERVQKARKKSVGKDKAAVNSKADKHLPA